MVTSLLLLLLFSHSFMSDSLQPHGMLHAIMFLYEGIDHKEGLTALVLTRPRNGLRDSLMTMFICITCFDPRRLLSNYQKKKKKGANRKLRHNIWALLENSQHETLIVIKTGRLCSLCKLFSREDPKGVTFPTVILSRFQSPTVFPTHLINLKLTPRNPVSQPLHPITWPSQWKILHILQENE